MKIFFCFFKMHNNETTKFDRRDLEPNMRRLCSEPNDLYQKEYRNVAPQMKRPTSEPKQLNNFAENFVHIEKGGQSMLRLQPQKNNYVDHFLDDSN